MSNKNDNDVMTCTRKDFMDQVVPKMKEAFNAGLFYGFIAGLASAFLCYLIFFV